ncbi:MAG: MFS transporter, partial [Gaiellales bacterium]
GLLLLGGRIADRVGHKLTLLLGIMIFTVASAIGGAAADASVLLGARAVQGMGAALMSPSALALVNTEFSAALRARALTLWAAAAGAGAAIGVVLGGLLTSGPGWRWTFLINLPIGVVAAVALLRLLPRRDRSSTRSLGLPSAALGTATITLILFAATEASNDGWGSRASLLGFAGSAAFAGAFIVAERRASDPLVRRQLLRNRQVVAGLVTMFGATAILLPLYFLTSIYLQEFRSFSAAETGALFLPATIGTILGAHLAGHLLPNVGFRAVGTVGISIGAAAILLLAARGTEGDLPFSLIFPFTLTSAGMGAAFVVATHSVMTGAGGQDSGATSGLISSIHELGASLGIALISSIAATNGSLDPSRGDHGVSSGYLATGLTAVVLAIGIGGALTTARPDPNAPGGAFH